MLIFNSGIKHSHEVTRAMRSSGFEAYHVDGDTPKELRKEYFKRLNTEPGFKLNNVGIATLGFDAPRIKSVMLNRLTKSLALYNQVCGRGSRPIEAGTDELMPEGKKDFNILDMHGSAVDMGEWQDDRNWTALFQQGKRKNNDGVAAKKICPQCDLLISKFAKTCPDCGYIFDMASALGSKDELNEEFDPQLVLFTKVKTQVHKYIEQAKEKDYNLFWALRQTNQALIKDIEKGTLTYTNYVEGMYNAGQEFCRKLGKRYDQFKRDYIDKLIDEFDKKNSEENAQLYNEKEEERNIYELII
jgi:superfamily II DNA or RNA helicase